MRRFVCLLAWLVVLVAGHMAVKASKGTWWTVPGLHPKTPQSRAWFRAQKNKVAPDSHKAEPNETSQDKANGKPIRPCAPHERAQGGKDGYQQALTGQNPSCQPQAESPSCQPLWNRITKNRCTT
ncbi:hypothetical protein EIL50_00495 [bacterium NHP-B]|nr:hypothetical protein EIL50_00495 [bacterium NHP-B]